MELLTLHQPVHRSGMSINLSGIDSLCESIPPGSFGGDQVARPARQVCSIGGQCLFGKTRITNTLIWKHAMGVGADEAYHLVRRLHPYCLLFLLLLAVKARRDTSWSLPWSMSSLLQAIGIAGRSSPLFSAELPGLLSVSSGSQSSFPAPSRLRRLIPSAGRSRSHPETKNKTKDAEHRCLLFVVPRDPGSPLVA